MLFLQNIQLLFWLNNQFILFFNFSFFNVEMNKRVRKNKWISIGSITAMERLIISYCHVILSHWLKSLHCFISVTIQPNRRDGCEHWSCCFRTIDESRLETLHSQMFYPILWWKLLIVIAFLSIFWIFIV